MNYKNLLLFAFFSYICISTFSIAWYSLCVNDKKFQKFFVHDFTQVYSDDFEKLLKSQCSQIYDNQLIRDELSNVYVEDGILSKIECDWIIKEAELHAKRNNGWTTTRHVNYPTTDLDTQDVPTLHYFASNVAYRKIFPLFEKYYGINVDYLGVDEIFVVKYSIGGQTSLKPHNDGDDLSFIIPLNSEFTGGGTMFIRDNNLVTPAPGSVVLFAGKNKHMAKEITSGVRYVLVGFCSLCKKGGCEHAGYTD